MSAAAADTNWLDGPISPELVLVSPPELAAQARTLLPECSFVQRLATSERVSIKLGLGFAIFVGVCLVSTLGPFFLAIAARAR